MKLEKLKSYDEWMRTERGDIFNELAMDYTHKYKRELGKDNLEMVMKDNTRYIFPTNITKIDFNNILKENNINNNDIKEINEIF
ncbi:hypothetical protein NE172_06380 [Clostridium botulinum]|uniref:Uncharacterized protein n=1 Tax=Clostridium botulinum TaxID=1491 RepID=A0A6B4JKX4_CLOBO|nr:hypothetical protein [Clostridium botulinum]EES48716.1 hypothetical protein CLO_2531 [Clostridium botulinum E1 str. 'BoNT E Beluga']MBY6760789.1 hypothetical protein [Clostridium botulinum]MBY6919919.1 hypothetical protein [Clostridium botulinum]MCR1130575.1 hypothetical protein [Clostridium botulinum]NFJ57477.1 hypothetical protein [Clostridium botulinum]